MMRRVGFVSNSSSSSFVIKKKDLTSIQIQKIIDYYEENNLSEEEKLTRCPHTWDISETSDEISGSTIIDNFDMDEYLEKIGVASNHIKWGWY